MADEQQPGFEDLVSMVTEVAYFLDDNLQQQFSEATGSELDVEDERLDVLAMFVIADAALGRLADRDLSGGNGVGGNAEKLEWARKLLRERAQRTLNAIVGDQGLPKGWPGAEEGELLSFAYATIASSHLNGLAAALDAMAQLGPEGEAE